MIAYTLIALLWFAHLMRWLQSASPDDSKVWHMLDNIAAGVTIVAAVATVYGLLWLFVVGTGPL